jgi:hypothetical protein
VISNVRFLWGWCLDADEIVQKQVGVLSFIFSNFQIGPWLFSLEFELSPGA